MKSAYYFPVRTVKGKKFSRAVEHAGICCRPEYSDNGAGLPSLGY